MAETTGIPWCDATWNPWIGCQKVSAGCQNCYAEKLAHFHGWVNEWGKDYKLTSDSNWKNPIKWAKQAVKDGVIRRVFCASLADVFDENVKEAWTARLHSLIWETGEIGGLEWLLLTKRPENIDDRLPFSWLQDPPPFIRIGTTVENGDVLDKRLTDLFKNWHGKNFVSVEPMLSAVQFKQAWIDYLDGWYTETELDSHGDPKPIQAPMPQIDWVICGCESGTSARPCNIEWIRDLRDQCDQSGTPFFLKQMSVEENW